MMWSISEIYIQPDRFRNINLNSEGETEQKSRSDSRDLIRERFGLDQCRGVIPGIWGTVQE